MISTMATGTARPRAHCDRACGCRQPPRAPSDTERPSRGTIRHVRPPAGAQATGTRVTRPRRKLAASCIVSAARATIMTMAGLRGWPMTPPPSSQPVSRRESRNQTRGDTHRKRATTPPNRAEHPRARFVRGQNQLRRRRVTKQQSDDRKALRPGPHRVASQCEVRSVLREKDVATRILEDGEDDAGRDHEQRRAEVVQHQPDGSAHHLDCDAEECAGRQAARPIPVSPPAQLGREGQQRVADECPAQAHGAVGDRQREDDASVALGVSSLAASTAVRKLVPLDSPWSTTAARTPRRPVMQADARPVGGRPLRATSPVDAHELAGELVLEQLDVRVDHDLGSSRHRSSPSSRAGARP